MIRIYRQMSPHFLNLFVPQQIQDCRAKHSTSKHSKTSSGTVTCLSNRCQEARWRCLGCKGIRQIFSLHGGMMSERNPVVIRSFSSPPQLILDKIVCSFFSLGSRVGITFLKLETAHFVFCLGNIIKKQKYWESIMCLNSQNHQVIDNCLINTMLSSSVSRGKSCFWQISGCCITATSKIDFFQLEKKVLAPMLKCVVFGC